MLCESLSLTTPTSGRSLPITHGDRNAGGLKGLQESEGSQPPPPWDKAEGGIFKEVSIIITERGVCEERRGSGRGIRRTVLEVGHLECLVHWLRNQRH